MATRDDLYRKFGPLLIEALVLIIKDEINILRTQAGLSGRTNQQLMDALENRNQTDDSLKSEHEILSKRFSELLGEPK